MKLSLLPSTYKSPTNPPLHLPKHSMWPINTSGASLPTIMATRCSPEMITSLMLLLFMASMGTQMEGGVMANEEHCSHTRYPALCLETLKAKVGGLGGEADSVVSLLVEKIKEETLLPLSNSIAASKELATMGSNTSMVAEAIEYCDELMTMSLKRLDQTLTTLKVSPKTRKADIQTWLSAVMTFQDSCKDSAHKVKALLTTEISNKMDHISMLASNALALANRIDDQGIKPGRQLFESSDREFPEWVSVEDRKLLEDDDVKPHAVVAQDGTGDYLTIDEALDGLSTSMAVGGRKVISIKAGVYKQSLKISQHNVMLVGQGKGNTKITNSKSVGGGTSMPNTATVVVTGDKFLAKDIAIENTAGASKHQALALRIASDHAVLYNCRLLGYQDTLYAHSLRQFYKGCDIYGSIDYIFGNAAAVFQGCNLIFRKPKGTNAVTAHGRTDPGQNTGFVIQGCNIKAGSEVPSHVKSYLGRPWKKYARVVFMQSYMDGSIHPKGWLAWSGSFALSTLYYGEYSNRGPGARTSGRVSWKGFHVMGTKDAAKFTVSNFIGGRSWIPSSGVSFKSGL